jgi:prepilin-type N-terminal cleavage/methylation domain-containing protein
MKKLIGFTLIEMLMVICIIGLIAALAVPAFGPKQRTYRLNSAADNLANAIEFARQHAMANGRECYVIFPVSSSIDANYQCRAYKLYTGESAVYTDETVSYSFSSTTGISVGKWEFLPTGLQFDSTSTALAGDDLIVPFPEDADAGVAMKYLECKTGGGIVIGHERGTPSSLKIVCSDDTSIFQNVTFDNTPAKVRVKDIGET